MCMSVVDLLGGVAAYSLVQNRSFLTSDVRSLLSRYTQSPCFFSPEP